MNLYNDAGFTPNIIFHSNDVESVLMMVAGEKENEEIVAVWRTINSKPQLPHFLENFNL